MYLYDGIKIVFMQKDVELVYVIVENKFVDKVTIVI